MDEENIHLSDFERGIVFFDELLGAKHHKGTSKLDPFSEG